MIDCKHASHFQANARHFWICEHQVTACHPIVPLGLSHQLVDMPVQKEKSRNEHHARKAKEILHRLLRHLLVCWMRLIGADMLTTVHVVADIQHCLGSLGLGPNTSSDAALM
eukprot:11032643-Karenia_brevis.AAC.1